MDNAPRPAAPPPLSPKAWIADRSKSGAASRLGLLAKILISGALLVFLSRKVDWPSVSARLAAAVPGPLLFAFALLIVTVFLAALRWRMLVQQGAARMTTLAAVQLTFAGMFFGQALPATVGGDVVRGVLAYRCGLPWRAVVLGVVLDRVVALLASLILILAGLPWLAAQAAGGAVPLVWTAFASVSLAGGLALALVIDRIPLPVRIANNRWIVGGLGLAKQVRSGLFSKTGGTALVISLSIHLSTVVIVVLIGRGLGVTVSPLAAFVAVPLAILAAAIPISLNGWGVREGVMVAGLSLFGISSGDALLISILLGFGVILSVLPGCLTWLALK